MFKLDIILAIIPRLKINKCNEVHIPYGSCMSIESVRLLLTARVNDIMVKKKLFSLNSSFLDDNDDRYKTANIAIRQLYFECLIMYLIFRTSSYL
jgi:hypothetical protein